MSDVEDGKRVPVRLTLGQWAVVQEALDTYFYEVEHAGPGGLRPNTRARNAARREQVLAMVLAIDAAIADQAGRDRILGP
jgi:hypothetical protein